MNSEKVDKIEETKQEILAALSIYALERNDLNSIMHRAVQQSCIALQLESSVIFRLTDDGKRFTVSDDTGHANENIDVEVDSKWDVGYTLETEEPVRIENYETESRFKLSPAMHHNNIISSAHVVIRGTNKVYGVFGFYAHEKREFTESDLSFLQVLAHIVAMAIEQNEANTVLSITNARLKEEMGRSEKYQKEILDNNIAERWEVGSYLHDNLAQMLASAKIMVSDIESKVEDGTTNLNADFSKLQEMLDQGIEGIRDLTKDIIPVDIESDGVTHAFNFLIQQTEKMYNVNCRLTTDENIDRIQNRQLATHLYHVVQEAMKNAVVHGEAENIEVAFQKCDDTFVLTIKDDGSGVTTSKEDAGKGICIMHHRVELLGGQLEITEWEEEGKNGTLVCAHIPAIYIMKEST